MQMNKEKDNYFFSIKFSCLKNYKQQPCFFVARKSLFLITVMSTHLHHVGVTRIQILLPVFQNSCLVIKLSDIIALNIVVIISGPGMYKHSTKVFTCSLIH